MNFTKSNTQFSGSFQLIVMKRVVNWDEVFYHW